MAAARGRLKFVLPGYARDAVPTASSATLAPRLRKLLARAHWRSDPRVTTAMLLEALGLGPDTSRAALLARAELETNETGWLRADPVHLRADAKLVMLFAPAAGDLSAPEADLFVAELRRRLPDFEWRRGREPRRWYVRVPDLETTPTLGPAWLHGRSLTPFFPQDPNYRRWRQTMTEVQMVMHGAPANAAREARGVLPLNALWIWGGGDVPTAATTPCVLVVATDLLVRGAAAAANVPAVDSVDPGTLAVALSGGDVLLAAGAPFGVRDGTATAPLEAANELAALAWSALGAGRAAAADLFGERLRGTLTAAARRYFWRTRADGAFGDPYAVTAS